MRILRRSIPLVCLVVLFLPPVFAQWEESGDVPYVPTPPEVVEAMLKLADVKSIDSY